MNLVSSPALWVLQELSISIGRLEPRHTMRHVIALRRRAKVIIVCMYVIASEYESSSISARTKEKGSSRKEEK